MYLKKEWFIEWFDSPYYHILYSNRDEKEAQYFIRNLCTSLKLNPKKHKIADLACGKGRHSIFLNMLGYEVTGVDLSPHSIRNAATFSNGRLNFIVQDLRELKLESKYDVALNLFTSFGYFNSMEEDEKVVRSVYETLNPQGLFVIDFMNSAKILANLVDHDSKTINGIRFTISKWTDSKFIHKKITVDDDDRTIEFTEKVQALLPEDFELILSKNGFKTEAIYGDYSLNPFDINQSDRFIIVARRGD